MHIPEEFIPAKHLTMQETFKKNLPSGSQYLPASQSLMEKMPLLRIKSVDPSPEVFRNRENQEDHPQKKWQYKEIKGHTLGIG
jgi:ethanolamine utilization cobalamin adenosyltransferase